jgi:protein SCO1/2
VRSVPILTFFLSALLLLGPTGRVFAQPGLPAAAVPSQLREVGFDQNLNQQIPLDVEFNDESGRRVRIGDYFGSRPVVIAFVYYDCPMLCMLTLNSLAGTLKALSQEPGKDFEMVTVSFDPREKPPLAREQKAALIERTGKPAIAAGWHLLTGDQADIDRLTRVAGFKYVWNESVQQFAHPTGLIVLTPSGRIARYLFGTDYPPRDLRLAVLDAAEGRVSSPIEKALLYCYHYDLATGRYSLAIMRLVQLAGALTVLSIGALIIVLAKRASIVDRRSAIVDRPSAIVDRPSAIVDRPASRAR